MNGPDFAKLVGPALASALEQKGFTSLMPVQSAVLDEALAGRDLRISSQTGSGKTVAIGFAVREFVDGPGIAIKGIAHPRAIVITPTRELAKQVHDELTWLYAPLKAQIASATGGGSARDERRAFAAGPAIIVGTPGRMLDHLTRGSIAGDELKVVVLDEADQMLDLGFRDDLEAILKFAPAGRRTHLVSATFPREVKALADRVQNDPAHIQGTPLGTANTDIDHVIHLVDARDRIGAITNLLLATPGGQTLVFARTRADVAEIARLLSEAGFQISALSGEMEQRERNVALAAFKRGTLHALVATDVAARGIDVQDITRVIHAEPPTDPDTYTHRSGRTGRAGKKGISSVLVSPAGLQRVMSLLSRARIRPRIEAVPTAGEIRKAADDRVVSELTKEFDETDSDDTLDPRAVTLAERVVAAGNVERSVARLLARSHFGGPAEPCEVRSLQPKTDVRPGYRDTGFRDSGTRNYRDRDTRGGGYGDRQERDSRPPAPGYNRESRFPERDSRPPQRATFDDGGAPRAHAPRSEKQGDDWVPFRVSWGGEHGADPRRMLAMACRRGGVRSNDIGAIDIGPTSSTIQVSARAAESFARAAGEPDPRDSRVTIRPDNGEQEAAPRVRAPYTQPPPARDDSEAEETPRAHRERPAREHAPREHAPRTHAPKVAPRTQAPREEAPRPSVREHAPREKAAEEEAPAPRKHARERVVEVASTRKPPKPAPKARVVGGDAKPRRKISH